MDQGSAVFRILGYLPCVFSPQQIENLSKVAYVWVSHGHPDHLNLESLELFRDKILLVPMHRGDRIASNLRMGRVQCPGLAERRMAAAVAARTGHPPYSMGIRMTALLIALGKQCGVLNLNDGGALGTRSLSAASLASLRAIIRFVLRLMPNCVEITRTTSPRAANVSRPFLTTRSHWGTRTTSC